MTRLVLLLLAAVVLVPAPAYGAPQARTLTFSYTAHDGATRTAYVVLSASYARGGPALPLVISPHGRGVSGAYNLRFWGSLPARGDFVLVSPDGEGRRLPLYSWGYSGQIDDLARMPSLVEAAFPWLRIDPTRIFAIGDSMGAQEALLLAAHPGVHLAGVAAFDPATDLAARYREWFETPGEQKLPARARLEVGGTPAAAPGAYAERSPASSVAAIARSGVPLELWWSRRDAVVTDQAHESGAFFRRLLSDGPRAPVQEIVGYWAHAHAMHPTTQLPAALACFGLLSPAGIRVPAFTRRADGTIAELPPGPTARRVPFSRTFCRR